MAINKKTGHVFFGFIPDVYVLFCIKNCVAATDFQIQLYAG